MVGAPSSTIPHPHVWYRFAPTHSLAHPLIPFFFFLDFSSVRKRNRDVLRVDAVVAWLLVSLPPCHLTSKATPRKLGFLSFYFFTLPFFIEWIFPDWRNHVTPWTIGNKAHQIDSDDTQAEKMCVHSKRTTFHAASAPNDTVYAMARSRCK